MAHETAGSGFSEIAAHYVEHRRIRAAQERAYFHDLSSDRDAIAVAASGEYPRGRRHPHQTRLSTVALQESRRRLVARIGDVLTAASFDELIGLLEQTVRRQVSGIGELAVYDIATRVGARISLEPTKVYLHRGTRVGAKILGFDVRRPALEMSELPAEFSVLKACEVEDVLCHYRRELATLTKGENLEPGCAGAGAPRPR